MNYTHVPNISCYFTRASEGALLSPEAHFEYEMILVTGGEATLVINHQHYRLKEKSLVFISRLERHSFIISKQPYERYVSSMSGDFLMSSIQQMELLPIFLQRPQGFRHVIDLSDQAYETLVPLFGSLAREYETRQAFYSARSAAVLVCIVIELYRNHPEAFPDRSQRNLSDAVLNAQRYINENFDRRVTLEEIARRNYISTHTMSVAFKDMVGIGFKEYLVQFRLAEAKKLLISTQLSIEEIAARVGYVNVNNFIRIFKDREQLTPLQYRLQQHS